jgi:hypothetical protein
LRVEQARGGPALVQGGGIDEGLEAGSRLTAHVHRPVELAVVEGVPADEGEDGAVPGGHRHQRAGNTRYGAELPAALVGLAQTDQVAGRYHVRDPPGLRSAPVRVAEFARPAHLAQVELDPLPVAEIDLGLALRSLGHQAGLELGHLGYRLEIGVHVRVGRPLEIGLGLRAPVAVASLVLAQGLAH